jgi:hypothetical protein
MATVSKQIADDIAAGKYSEDGAVKIIEYDNAFGGVSYGVVFKKDYPDKYAETEFVQNPRLYWSASK